MNQFQNRKDGVRDTMGNPIHVLKSPEEKEGIINCRYDLVAETALNSDSQVAIILTDDQLAFLFS